MISRFQLGHDQSYGDLSTEMFGKRRWWRYNIVIGQIHVVLFIGQRLGSVFINSKTRIKSLRLIFLFSYTGMSPTAGDTLFGQSMEEKIISNIQRPRILFISRQALSLVPRPHVNQAIMCMCVCVCVQCIIYTSLLKIHRE